jgi:death on curing protein
VPDQSSDHSAVGSVRYLTADEIWAMNDGILQRDGNRSILLDRGGLEAAAMRPQSVAYYEGADLVAQAAALITGIALNHPFLDGNKRTAAIAGYTFLDLNGWRLAYEGDEYGRQLEVYVLANDRDAARQALVEWLSSHLIPR